MVLHQKFEDAMVHFILFQPEAFHIIFSDFLPVIFFMMNSLG